MPDAEVISGLRAPQAVRLEERAARAAAPESAQPAIPTFDPAGPTTYRSKYVRYRVQITAPGKFTNPATGQTSFAGRQVEAQFDDYVYRNTERDPEMRDLIDKTLQSNPHFGKFGNGLAHFWLVSDQKAAMETMQLEAALKTLKSLPKAVVDAHLKALAATPEADHKLPARGESVE